MHGEIGCRSVLPTPPCHSGSSCQHYSNSDVARAAPRIKSPTPDPCLPAMLLCLSMPSCRILWSFKLNPYERLNLRFTATPDEIRKQFRKLSLMVHPDKCKHAQAADAFDSEWPLD